MIDAKLLAKIDAFFEANKEDLIEDIRTLVAIPSVEGKAEPGAPFGAEPRKALDAALEIAGGMGLETKNCEGYLGYAELPGADPRTIASISHLDVVPEGNGWVGEPFVMRERDGWLIGRGTGDNKGPSVAMLYVLKYFKENGGLKYGLRALLGTNEETNMFDVEYYLENYPAPEFAFTPDGAFPVGIGEKGIYNAKLFSGKVDGGNVLEMGAGTAFNVVPDRTYAIVKAGIACPAAENIEITEDAKGTRVLALGKGAHAASPQNGVNATKILVDYLLANGIVTEEEKPFFEAAKQVLATPDASAIGLASDDGLFDPLTCCSGMASVENGEYMISVDIRYPTSTSGNVLTAGFEKLFLPIGGRVETGKVSAPFYIKPEDPAIQCLLNTYNEIAGVDEKPFVMGGGTYARKFPKAVSFGLGRMNSTKPDFIGNAHGAEEGISLAAIKEAFTIFIIAILRLQEIEL